MYTCSSRSHPLLSHNGMHQGCLCSWATTHSEAKLLESFISHSRSLDYYGDNLASISLLKINTPQALVKATVAWGWGGL